MSTQVRFFIARNQKTFGPLSADEIEALRQSGQLAQYTWIFQDGESQWTPIDPPPAVPVTVTSAPTKRGHLSVVPTPPLYTGPANEAQESVSAPVPEAVAARARQLPEQAFRVILFDHRNAISGWVVEASDSGCVIRSERAGTDPLFVQKEAACLTLQDTRTGEGLKLKIRVSEISREGRGWCYRIRWNAAPALLGRPELSIAA